MNKFAGQSIDELEVLREQINTAINGMSDSVALAESIPGQKWIKRLQLDVSAVRSKYLNIRGDKDMAMRELHRLQGQEGRIKEELDILTNAVSYEKRLCQDLDELTLTLRQANKKVESR